MLRVPRRAALASHRWGARPSGAGQADLWSSLESPGFSAGLLGLVNLRICVGRCLAHPLGPHNNPAWGSALVPAQRQTEAGQGRGDLLTAGQQQRSPGRGLPTQVPQSA